MKTRRFLFFEHNYVQFGLIDNVSTSIPAPSYSLLFVLFGFFIFLFGVFICFIWFVPLDCKFLKGGGHPQIIVWTQYPVERMGTKNGFFLPE